MGQELKEKKKWLSDNQKAGILRWWIAGMCYFLIGFGTQSGLLQDPLDLIFLLGVATGLAMVLVYEPVAYGMFKIVRRGQIMNRPYYERSGWKNARYKLAEIFKSLFLVGLVYFTYQNVNMLLTKILDLPIDTVVIPGEPIGFATLYVFYRWLVEGLADKVRTIAEKDGGQ